jgi:hypothetical protein
MALKHCIRAGQIGHAVKLPIVGHALENVYAEIFECDAGARHNFLDGARDDVIVPTSKTRYPPCDVYCDVGRRTRLVVIQKRVVVTRAPN